MAVTSIEHGQVYRFLSYADNRFLDLHMKTTDHGSKLIVWDGNTSNAQRFRAEVVDDGFRLLSQCRRKGEPLRVITEQVDGKGLVIYADQCADSNHMWKVEVHQGEPEKFVMIINKGSGKALAHQGYKNQVRCINPDPNDVHQQWKLLIAEHDQCVRIDTRNLPRAPTASLWSNRDLVAKKTLFKTGSLTYPVPALQAKVSPKFRALVSNSNSNSDYPYGNSMPINQNQADIIFPRSESTHHHVNTNLVPSHRLQLQTSDPRYSYLEGLSNDIYDEDGGPTPFPQTTTVQPAPSKAVSNIQSFFVHLMNYMSPEEKQKLLDGWKHSQHKGLPDQGPEMTSQNKRSIIAEVRDSSCGGKGQSILMHFTPSGGSKRGKDDDPGVGVRRNVGKNGSDKNTLERKLRQLFRARLTMEAIALSDD